MGSKSTSKTILNKWFVELNKEPIIIQRFDIVELTELQSYIKQLEHSELELMHELLAVNPTLDKKWAYENISSFGVNYNRLVWLLKKIDNRIDELNLQSSIENRIPKKPSIVDSKNNRIDYKIFRDKYSYNLFRFIIENTSIKNRSEVGALYHWFLNRVNCSKYEFAEYWNSLDLDFKIKLYNEKRSASFPNESRTNINLLLDDLKSEFDNSDNPK